MVTSTKSLAEEHHWWLLIALLLCCLCLSSLARAQEMMLNPTGRDIQLTSLLRISDTVLGEAELTITADNQLLLPKDSTLALLSSVITQEAIQALRATSTDDQLSQQQFEQIGLTLAFDFATLECVITVPPEHSLRQQLSLREAEDIYSYVDPSLFSGYLNVALSANKSQLVEDESERQSLYRAQFDSALNLKRLNLEYESYLENGSDTEASYIREGTRFNYDFPDQGTRLVVGDMYNSGSGFQDAADILGVGITRDFSIIPTRNVRPRANQSFTLQRTSNVDVYVDGIAVRRLTLGAGSYDLSDIPLARGTNDIELVITDRSGNEERIEFSVATGNGLLNTGEFEYSLLYGVPAQIDDGERDYLTDERILHGYVDVGVAPWLTLGVNSQTREDLNQYGVSALIASGWGVTELTASQSDHPEHGHGNAYKIAFDALFPDHIPMDPQLSVSYEYFTNSFSGISSLDATEEDIHLTTHYFSAFGSLYINRSLRTALTFNYRAGVDSDNDYWIASPSLSAGLFDTPATWSARLNYKHSANGEDDDIGATLSISWPLSRQTRLVGRHATNSDETSLDYSYQNNIGSTGGISAFASAVNSQDADADLNAGVNYAANRYELNASHTTRLTDLKGEQRSHSTDVTVSSALAFAGSTFSVGRPVREAFAIVKKHPSLAENEMAVDPSRDGKHARVYLQGDGTAMVPDLVAYNSQNLSYDIKNLPPGYDLGEGAFWLNPGYKNGYLLEVGSDAALTVIGKLFDQQTQQPISLVAGSAHYLGSGKQAPIEFFSNRNGVFAISGLKPGPYKLILDTRARESVTVDLSKHNTTLIRLGDLYVE
ncbi:fimbria/pilus outer membrane usher protein [Marinomonas ostreistagni]|uniref:fimbria/pilus outer membrane usher protein n=1 Tax=Marinomonas ostreistagni TaxID=359209 RepID=UPI00194E72F1|nr:fimbria/pilus outer membrane usher protein [Marinomonas ostreistagni]MBM6549902.1 fimbrial biogenesis outer membrane usher protein [Marinomonas ostreistagni]